MAAFLLRDNASAQIVGPTVLTEVASIFTGRAPEVMILAIEFASSKELIPSIIAFPSLITALTVGLVKTSPSIFIAILLFKKVLVASANFAVPSSFNSRLTTYLLS